jgi:NitT/TauT family transport system substrate-binding protein
MKKNRFGRYVLFLLIVALVSGMVAGCGGSTETADKEAVKFKIGHCTWVGYGPLYIAQEKGFFADHNIQPEMVIIISIILLASNNLSCMSSPPSR